MEEMSGISSQAGGIKRSSEESYGNGSGDDGSKKVRLDENPPSKVIHIRSIPSDCTETEVVQLGLPFGRMNNILVLKQKNQAFLEMEDVSVAQAMVNYYNDCQAIVRGRRVYLQYSKHKELKTDDTHAHTNAAAQAALHAAQTLVGADQTSSGSKPILRVIVDNMLFPVTIDALHTIFSRFGSVLRIVTFNKNNTFQALVQFSDVHAAQDAKENLDGLNVYNGCCTLRIDFSKLTTLSVKYNNDKSRDFTNPSLPTGGDDRDPMPLGGAGLLGSGRSFGGGLGDGAFGLGGGLGGLGSDRMDRLDRLGRLERIDRMGDRLDRMDRMDRMGRGMDRSMSRSGIGSSGMGGSPCILVSNLDEQMVTPDRLFTLFGVYGDVMRVKILFNKKDNALIQYSDPRMAELAIQFLDKAILWGQSIRVAPSKHSQVQLPREGQDKEHLTKDFSNSPLHRFKKPGSKNFQNIYPPSSILHLSNIPTSVTEEDIVDKFKMHGKVAGFKFFQKDRKMALIEMASAEEGIAALMGMHDHQFVEGQSLRVSFSKSRL